MKTNSLQDVVKAHLDKRAAEDPLFAVTYAKENKNIKQCCDYIMGRARKECGNGGHYVHPDVVFGWAIHYYDEDDIKAEKASNAKAAASTYTDKPKAKKEKAPVPQAAEVKQTAPKLKVKQKKEEGVEQLSFGF